MSKTEQTPAKKGTLKSEAIIGQGVKSTESAVKSLETAILKFAELPRQVENYSLQIAEKEDQLAQLNVELAERKRQNKLALEMDIKENQAGFIKTYLDSNGLIAITKEEHAILLADIQALKQGQKAEIEKAVAIATNSLKSQYTADTKVKEAEFAKQQAEDKSQVSQMVKEIAFLNTQVSHWQKQLEEERKASVDRAKASAVGAIHVGQQGSR